MWTEVDLDITCQSRFNLGGLDEIEITAKSMLLGTQTATILLMDIKKTAYPWEWETHLILTWFLDKSRSSVFGQRGPPQLGVPLHAKFCSVFKYNQWNLPSARLELQVLLYSALTLIYLIDDDDKLIWSIDGVVSDSFCKLQSIKQNKNAGTEGP